MHMSRTISAVLKLVGVSFHVTQIRCGGGFAAFICHNDHVDVIINGLLDSNSDYEELHNSFVYADWYPMACGDAPLEAITKLAWKLDHGPLSYGTNDADGKYALSMLLGRIADRNGNLISAEGPTFHRKHSVGPYGKEWVDELSDLLDKTH